MCGDDVAGLEVLSQLAEECEDRILLVGRPARVGVAVVMMVMRRARLRAGLLQILLDVGERLPDFSSWASCETAVASGLVLWVPEAGPSRELCWPLRRSC